MENPNSDSLCKNLLMFSFNEFSDCVLIIEVETHPKKLSHFPSAASRGDESCSMEECPRIEKLHVNSAVLAEKSPFIHNLFKNGTMETGHRCVALSIHASEETAVTELLNYMHGGAVTATTEPALLDVLKVADRFQVASCMKLCESLLLEMPMTTKAAFAFVADSHELGCRDELEVAGSSSDASVVFCR